MIGSGAKFGANAFSICDWSNAKAGDDTRARARPSKQKGRRESTRTAFVPLIKTSLTDEHFVLDVNTVDLFRRRREQHLETFPDAGHDRRDLARRFDDLALDKIRC